MLLAGRAARPARRARRRARRALPGTALFEWTGPRSSITAPYRVRWESHDGRWHEGYDPYSFPLEIDDERSRSLRRRQSHPCASLPRRARAHDRRRARHPLRRLGAERRARQRRRHVQSLGWPLPPDERARQLGRLGAVHARARRRRALQVRDLHARQPRAQAQDRSVRRRVRESARDGEHYDAAARRSRWDDAAWLEQRAQRDWLKEPISIYEVHLGSWRRSAAGQFPELSRARGAARRVRQGSRLHARRAAADHGASVRRLVGLSVHGLLRADEPARLARRAARARRRAAPARHRRAARLGAGPLPEGRSRARALRRHGAVRIRRPAERRASRLGHARVQLHAQRGAELPAVERDLLARGLPLRRAARRRRRLDAVSRLLAQAAPMDAEPARRQREPRGDRVLEAA